MRIQLPGCAAGQSCTAPDGAVDGPRLNPLASTLYLVCLRRHIAPLRPPPLPAGPVLPVTVHALAGPCMLDSGLNFPRPVIHTCGAELQCVAAATGQGCACWRARHPPPAHPRPRWRASLACPTDCPKESCRSYQGPLQRARGTFGPSSRLIMRGVALVGRVQSSVCCLRGCAHETARLSSKRSLPVVPVCGWPVLCRPRC